MLPTSSTTQTTTDRTVTVFWPRGLRKEGICYGWTKPALCIVGILDNTANVDSLTSTLDTSTLWSAVKDCCNGNPTLLGTCKFNDMVDSPVPISLMLWKLGDEAPTFSYVLYHPNTADSLRFYAMDPPTPTAAPAVPSRDPYRELANQDFTRSGCRDLDLAMNAVVINQINASSLLQTILQSSTSPKLLPITASFLLTCTSYLGSFSAVYLSFSKFVQTLVNFPGPSPRLKDVSAIVQQLDVRIEQGVFFITQVATLKRQNTRDVASYSVRYTEFFNTAWLMINDITFGVACGAFLSENSDFLAKYGNNIVQAWLFDFPRAALYWLDAWPAGLKLNAELSRFYVHTLIGVIDTWSSILPPLTPRLFTTLGFLSSIGGLTLLLSVLSDLLSLFLTVHLRIGYELTRAVYWAAGVRIGGGLLWGVFHGKRHNVLRKRTDTWSYDIDQLLFGTVLFTLLAFLFPTALVYYVLFAGLRLTTLLTQASIETLLAFMHHFPLFALVQRVKDPWRLPGGVYFTLHVPSPIKTGRMPKRDGQTNDPPPPAYLVLENKPMTLSAIFFQYIELWNRLAKHYNPLRLLYRVLAGQHLASIPRYSIRYTPGPDLLKEKEE